MIQGLRASIGTPFRARARLGGAPLAWALCLLLCALASTAWGQTSALGRNPFASDDQVKAAYLYKFPHYIEWPPAAFPAADSPYVIGVAGSEGVFRELSGIAAGRTINNRPVAIRRLQALDDLAGVHIVYVGGSKAQQAQWAGEAGKRPILVVTDTEGTAPPGSMVNFVLAEARVRFEVFLGPAEAAGIRINSRMLSVASSVIKGSP